MNKTTCLICKKSFDRVLTHVRQTHKVDSDTYRKRFGYCKGTALISANSAEKTRQKTLKNYDKVIRENLIKKGEKTRFKKGHNWPVHEMRAERYEILVKARSMQDLTKPRARCISCGKFLSSRKGKLCLKHYRLAMAERNKKNGVKS